MDGVQINFSKFISPFFIFSINSSPPTISAPALFASSDQGQSTYLWKDFKTGNVVNTNSNLFPIWRDIYIAIRDANNVIANIENINIDSDYKKLENLSNELWDKYSYKEEEEDRVVLNVSLKASQKSNVKFERSYLLDAWGDKNYTAMARLVSIPVALAVEAILKNKISIGVSPAPKSSEIVADWLDEIKKEAQIFKFINKS